MCGLITLGGLWEGEKLPFYRLARDIAQLAEVKLIHTKNTFIQYTSAHCLGEGQQTISCDVWDDYLLHEAHWVKLYLLHRYSFC